MTTYVFKGISGQEIVTQFQAFLKDQEDWAKLRQDLAKTVKDQMFEAGAASAYKTLCIMMENTFFEINPPTKG